MPSQHPQSVVLQTRAAEARLSLRDSGRLDLLATRYFLLTSIRLVFQVQIRRGTYSAERRKKISYS